MAMTDAELMAMIKSKAPGVVESVASVDPALQAPLSSQTQVPAPTGEPQPSQSTGYLGAVGTGMETLGDQTAGLSRGLAQGVQVTPIKVEILARKVMNTMGWGDEADIKDLQAKVRQSQADFMSKEAAMGTPTAGNIGSVLGEVAAGSVAGGVLGKGVNTALTAWKGAGSLLPALAGQATTAATQGAIAQSEGSLLDSAKAGGKQAALATALSSLQGAQYLRQVRPPGEATGLSRRAALGKSNIGPDVKQARGMAKDYFRKEIGEEQTLAEKFRTSLDAAGEKVALQNKANYESVLDEFNSAGKISIQDIENLPAVQAVFKAPAGDASTRMFQKEWNLFKKQLGKNTFAPVPGEAPSKLNALKQAILDEGLVNSDDFLLEATPRELHQFMTISLKKALSEKNGLVIGARDEIENSLLAFGKQFKSASGKTLDQDYLGAKDFFKKVALPVRNDVKKISKSISEGRLSEAVDYINTSPHAAKTMRIIERDVGKEAHEALGDAIVAKTFKDHVNSFTFKNGENVDVAALSNSLLKQLNTPVMKSSSYLTKQRAKLYVDFVSKFKDAPRGKDTGIINSSLGFLKGSLSSIPSLFDKLLNSGAGRVMLTRAAGTPANSIARQRFYLELNRMLSVGDQIEDRLDSRPAAQESDEDFIKRIKGQ